MDKESIEGKMKFEDEEEVPQAQVPVDGEPLARPPTVAGGATSPEGRGLSAQPGVRPPLQATAEIPGVEVTVAMGSAWVSPGVPVTCPGVTVGLGVAARQPLAAWKLPLIATNLLVSKLNNCVVAAHPLLPPTDVDSLGSVTHSGGEARSLLRLRGGGHEDEDQENLGKNTENTGKFLAISDSSATGHGFLPEGFPQNTQVVRFLPEEEMLFPQDVPENIQRGEVLQVTGGFSFTQNAEEIQSGDFSRSAETDFFTQDSKKVGSEIFPPSADSDFSTHFFEKTRGDNFPQGAGAFFPENIQRPISLPSAHSATLFKRAQDYENRGPPPATIHCHSCSMQCARHVDNLDDLGTSRE